VIFSRVLTNVARIVIFLVTALYTVWHGGAVGRELD